MYNPHPQVYIIPTTRYIIPTPRYIIPTLRYIIPTTRCIIPTPRCIIVMFIPLYINKVSLKITYTVPVTLITRTTIIKFKIYFLQDWMGWIEVLFCWILEKYPCSPSSTWRVKDCLDLGPGDTVNMILHTQNIVIIKSRFFMFLSKETLIFLSLHLCNLMSKTLNISN